MIRWTQWIFIQLFNKGLAYQAEVAVNWCPALGTVLANEEIIDGKSERGDHPVVRMPMKQVGTLQPISACLTVCELFTQLVLMYYYGRSVLPYDNTCRLGSRTACCVMVKNQQAVLCCFVSAALQQMNSAMGLNCSDMQ